MVDPMITLNSRVSGLPRFFRPVHHELPLRSRLETLAEARAVTAVVTMCRESCTNEYRIRESHQPATPDSKETCW